MKSTPWEKYEDDAVIAHAVPDAELSAQLNRSIAAIRERRCRLNNPGGVRNRWRKSHPQGRNRERARNYDKGATNKHSHGKRWSQAEDKAVRETDGTTDRQLAQQLGRTVRAIQGRRYNLAHRQRNLGGG